MHFAVIDVKEQAAGGFEICLYKTELRNAGSPRSVSKGVVDKYRLIAFSPKPVVAIAREWRYAIAFGLRC